jgi:hypothetical protein
MYLQSIISNFFSELNESFEYFFWLRVGDARQQNSASGRVVEHGDGQS